MLDKKRLGASCAAVAALAALFAPGTAMAANTGIVLSAAQGQTLAGHSFTAYRIGDYSNITVSGDTVSGFSVSNPTVANTQAWLKGALTSANVSVPSGYDEAGAISKTTNATSLRRIANALAKAATKPAAVVSGKTSSTGTLTLDVPDGLYLITDTNEDALPMIVGTKMGGKSTAGATLGKLTVKGKSYNVDKKLVMNGEEQSSGSVAVGRTATYHIKTTLPNIGNDGSAVSVHIVDNMVGQKFKSLDSVTVGGQSVDKNQVKLVGTDGNGGSMAAPSGMTGAAATPVAKGEIGFNLDALCTSDHSNKQVVLTVTTTITATGDNNHVNKVTGYDQWYDPATNTTNRPTTPPTSQVQTKTGDVRLSKTDSQNTKLRLADAGFKIQNTGTGKWLTYDFASKAWSDAADEASATQFLTGDANLDGTLSASEKTAATNGDLKVSGLASGTYLIKETKAPAGYVSSNIGMPTLTAVLDAEKGAVTYKGEQLPNLTTVNGDAALVANMKSLTELPLTGGVWTAATALTIAAAFAGIAFAGVGASRRLHDQANAPLA